MNDTLTPQFEELTRLGRELDALDDHLLHEILSVEQRLKDAKPGMQFLLQDGQLWFGYKKFDSTWRLYCRKDHSENPTPLINASRQSRARFFEILPAFLQAGIDALKEQIAEKQRVLQRRFPDE